MMASKAASRRVTHLLVTRKRIVDCELDDRCDVITDWLLVSHVSKCLELE